MVKIGDHYFHVDPTHDDNPRDYDHFLKSDKDIESRDEWHEIWKFEIPNTSRVLHNYPSYMPECKYSVGDANMDGFINKGRSSRYRYCTCGCQLRWPNRYV